MEALVSGVQYTICSVRARLSSQLLLWLLLEADKDILVSDVAAG